MTDQDTDLETLVAKAVELGNAVDIEDAHYGPSSWGTEQFITRPSPYYYFLAGWCALTRASRVIEVGTHYGGSTLALLKGMQDPSGARLVTMDVTDLNAERLAQEAAITKIVGSGSDATVQGQAVAALGSESCDLLYVDALKDGRFVLDVIDGFRSKVAVKYAILDDINIVPDMREMWKTVSARYGANAVDVSASHPSVRAENVGFGLIRFTD